MPTYNGFNNPFAMGSYNPNGSVQRYHIERVNGKEGVDNFQMLPNSETILLDKTAPLVWLVQTDNFGNKTVAPYTITPYTPPKQLDVNDLLAEIQSLREEIANVKCSQSDATAARAEHNE